MLKYNVSSYIENPFHNLGTRGSSSSFFVWPTQNSQPKLKLKDLSKTTYSSTLNLSPPSIKWTIPLRDFSLYIHVCIRRDTFRRPIVAARMSRSSDIDHRAIQELHKLHISSAASINDPQAIGERLARIRLPRQRLAKVTHAPLSEPSKLSDIWHAIWWKEWWACSSQVHLEGRYRSLDSHPCSHLTLTSPQDVPTESQVKYIAREVLNHQELSLFEHPVRMLFSLEGRRRRRIHGRILTSSSSSYPVAHCPAPWSRTDIKVRRLGPGIRWRSGLVLVLDILRRESQGRRFPCHLPAAHPGCGLLPSHREGSSRHQAWKCEHRLAFSPTTTLWLTSPFHPSDPCADKRANSAADQALWLWL